MTTQGLPLFSAVGISGIHAGEDVNTAHVYDHRPEAASFLNLAALCQKCHNGHDAEMRRKNRRERERRESGQTELAL